MKTCIYASAIVPFAIAAMATSALAEDAKAEAIKRDREKIAGTWRIVSVVINGNKGADADVQRLTVVNGNDGTWTLYDAGKEISKGTSTFDPTQSPKHIDFTPTEGGGKGEHYLGIYELGENTRKMCFAPPGSDRPTRFASEPGSQHILVTFERQTP